MMVVAEQKVKHYVYAHRSREVIRYCGFAYTLYALKRAGEHAFG